jgi:hypothetical protein
MSLRQTRGRGESVGGVFLSLGPVAMVTNGVTRWHCGHLRVATTTSTTMASREI